MGKANKIFKNNIPFIFSKKLVGDGFGFLSNFFRTKVFNINAKRGPFFVTWMCTYNCNADCKFCNTREMNELHPDAVSEQRVCEVAHEIGKAGTRLVGFTGGEPFLWPHLYKAIRILKSYGIFVYIITNGYLLKENVEKIFSTEIDMVSVSIDSDVAEEHNENRCLEGVFERAIEGMDMLKKKRRGKKPLIKTTTVLSKKTYPKIKKIIDYLSGLSDFSSIQPIANGYMHNPHNIKEENRAEFYLEQEEEGVLKGALSDLVKYYPDIDSYYVRQIPVFLYNPKKLLKVKCWSPFLRLQILPHGDVVHCIANKNYSVVGNLNQNTFMEIWNSDEIKRQREDIRCGNNNCICWSQDSSFNAFLHKIPLINKFPLYNKKRM